MQKGKNRPFLIGLPVAMASGRIGVGLAQLLGNGAGQLVSGPADVAGLAVAAVIVVAAATQIGMEYIPCLFLLMMVASFPILYAIHAHLPSTLPWSWSDYMAVIVLLGWATLCVAYVVAAARSWLEDGASN